MQPDSTTAIPLKELAAIQDRVLWLATNMIHHANNVRPSRDGLKVGGHQASCASMVTIMTTLYFHYLRQGDRVSVKPHASPVFHAIQYLLGQIPQDYLTTLRQFGGLQAYPSRTKDPDRVDFSTGSVGLGAVAPAFAALAGDYISSHFDNQPKRRFVAVVGDAELDEGNVWEAILDEPLRNLGNLLWIVDLNRQSLDRVIPGIKAARLKKLFDNCGWQVLEAKYGQRLQQLFAMPEGHRLTQIIDEMTNVEYQSVIRLPGADMRDYFVKRDAHMATILADVADEDMAATITDLGGHDFTELLTQLEAADNDTQRPTVLFAYTVKGWNLPIAGHPMNHSMLLDMAQMATLRQKLAVGDDEWARFDSQSAAGKVAEDAATRLYPVAKSAPATANALLPADFSISMPTVASTQQSFGRQLLALSRHEALARYIVTASPDVSVSTNLSGWINKFGQYSRRERLDLNADVQSAQMWEVGPTGRHIELGISEMNLFMLLGMFGISSELLEQLLIPIGTVYDPFVCRGLDAFIYALYSGAKFIVAGTPSGISLAPEGGAHQSTVTNSLGTELPNLNYYEPCYAQELAWILLHAIENCLDRATGRSTYLRLSTKQIEQAPFNIAQQRIGEANLRHQVLQGGYRIIDWRTQADVDPATLIHIAVSGAMVPEALAAAEELQSEGIAVNVLNVTSPRKLYESWLAGGRGGRRSHPLAWLIPADEQTAPIITINDAASHALAWLGSAFGAPVIPLGVDYFGQSGDQQALYAHFGIDRAGIVDAALSALDWIEG